MDPRRLTGAARIVHAPLPLRLERWRARRRYGLTQPAMSDAGLMDLAGHEALVLSPYWDSVHVLSWGMGHTRAAGSPNPATLWGKQSTIRDVLQVARVDLVKYERGVDASFTRPLSQPQKDAATSFNYSTGAIATATWVKLFNAGDIVGARKSFMTWVKPPEIKARRQAECDLFFDGVYSNVRHTAALIPANGNGTLLWSQAREVDLIPWIATGRRAA
jgi:lysozyme